MDFLTVEFSPKEEKRIYKNIEKVGGCWIWIGATDSCGYAQGFYRGSKEKVHRLVYAQKRGPIPKGNHLKMAQLDHLCRNVLCCNPEHLELVSAQVNVLRGFGITAVQARLTECKYGHPFKPQSRGGRYCPTCDNLRHKKRMKGPKRDYWLKKQREATARYDARNK